MNLEERMASLNNKLNDRLNGNNSTTNCNLHTESFVMFCPECGNKLEEESNFCPHCGHNFNDTMSTASNTDRVFEEEKYSYHNGGEENKGIIMTDTVLLAKKYGVSRYDVQKTVNKFTKNKTIKRVLSKLKRIIKRMCRYVQK